MRSRMSDVGNGVIVCWPDDESERFLIATTIAIAGLLVSSATSKCDNVTSLSAAHTNKIGKQRRVCGSVRIPVRNEDQEPK